MKYTQPLISDASKFQELMAWVKEHEDIVPDHLHDIDEFGRWHKPVCADCQIGMEVDENGVYVIDTFQDPPTPYRMWSTDRWVCPVCKHKAIVGFSNNAHEHFQEGFDDRLALAKASPHVYCFEKRQHALDFLAINSTDLLPGKWVDIYQKPLTGEDFEGRARLEIKLSDNSLDPAVQRWLVRFVGADDDEETYERTIYTVFANAGTVK